MALFKISKGSVANLNNQTKVDGYAWFTPEDGKFYIDAPVGDNNELKRVQLNSKFTVSAALSYANSAFTLGTLDKTYAEIVAAKTAGNYVVCKLTIGSYNIELPLVKATSTSVTFEGDFIYDSVLIHGNVIMNSSGTNTFSHNTILGGTYKGNFSANSARITNLAAPVNSTDAVNLNYLSTNYKKVQKAVADPTTSTSASAIDFIDTISQNAQGVISVTKKPVRNASTSVSGVVSTDAQSFAGNKTFTGTVTAPSLQITNGALINTGTGTILGTSKTVTKVSQQLVLGGGAVFSGTALNAGLVTRGICGVTAPDANGTCEKAQLFINYDGDGTYNIDRGLILNAGGPGKDLGKGLYQYAVPRGDIVADYVKYMFSANDAMLFKGVLGTGTDMISTGLPDEHEAGWTYKVGTAGSFAGQWCEIGDTIYCIKDGTAASNNDWAVIQVNNEGIIYRSSRDTAVGSASNPVYVNSSGIVTACTNSSITGVGSVKNKFTIKLNGGSTEGTNLFTFDGSAAKTVNITASGIGAAASSHTHNYAGSSSAGGAATSALTCTGNAATATKLATARTINGTSFNGTGNITTANWGTARTLTIGNTGKSVNGSANVSWTLAEIGAGNTNRIVVQNKTVATSAWASNSTYSDYPYRAAIAITGVTANHFPEVVFSCSDATSGNYAPVVESYAGGVYIWAKEKPSATITIPTIECRATA